MTGTSDNVWSANDTSPGEVEAALRHLLFERHAQNASFLPARVLNLVCVVDKQWSGEIANRLGGVGRSHASRTIVCAVEPGRRTVDAVAMVAAEQDPRPGELAPTRETVILTVGETHLDHLDTLVGPLVVTDLPTAVWSPHGHHRAVDALRTMSQVALLDTDDEADPTETLPRARSLAEELYVVDLAWLRTTPWRERIAATFDPVPLRRELSTVSSVEVRHHPESGASAVLLVGWLASRLDWRTERLVRRDSHLSGSAHGRRQDVDITLTPAPRQQVRGLEGLTLQTASGRHLSLDRGPGGLRARYRNEHRKVEREWTVLGASRGEGGILGNAIRQALARDRTYLPALEAAAGMAR